MSWQVSSPITTSSSLSFTSRKSSVSIAYYQTDYELLFYLRAIQCVRTHSVVIVLGLRERKALLTTHRPNRARMLVTSLGNEIDADDVTGCFIKEPSHAIAMALKGIQRNEGLIVLFPADWQGEAVESMIEKAQHQCPRLANDPI